MGAMFSAYSCPMCGSSRINIYYFDFINFCLDCSYKWEVDYES